MQSKFYGNCSGTSKSKYDVFLTVKENSQSIEDNKSNITVKLYVKRNDGYSASAYNLYEAKNSVKLTVDDSVKVSKNLTIDTRNNETVLLASWTGDVSHNEDGKLSLSVKGTFTMGNTGLSGGTASGTFKCTYIPRVSSAAISHTTVNPGSEITAALSVSCDSFTHKIKWSLGKKSQTEDIPAGVKSASFTIPVAWTKYVTDSTKGIFKITLYTYYESSLVGEKSYTLSFIIPATDAYKPEFDIVLNRIDNGVPPDFQEYVQGISQVEVGVQNINCKYAAEFKSISIKIGSVVKKTYPETFNLPLSGETEITVTLKDSRGLTAVKKEKISVCEYSPPSVNVVSVVRCDESGAESTYGEYLFAKYNLSYSSVNGKNEGSFSVSYKSSQGELCSSPILISGNSAIIGNGDISINNSYTLCFEASDSIVSSPCIIQRSVPSANIPFNIKKGGKGAAFGMFSEYDNNLSVGWDLDVHGNITADGNLSLNGNLNYENVQCSPTEYTEDLNCIIRYFPPLDLCFVRLRATVKKKLSANEACSIAQLTSHAPSIYTTLTCYASQNTGFQRGGINNEGKIRIMSQTDVAAGSSIYVTGFYYLNI